MTRILIGLAGLNTLILLFTFGIGLASEGRANVTPDVALTAAQQHFTLHLVGGLSAALLTLLLHSLVFTYFIGTGRWVHEVVKAYGLPGSMWDRTRALKIQALPYVLGGIFLVFLAATMGAATDVGSLDRNYHLVAASLAVLFNAWSYLREYQVVAANGEIISEIMDNVNRMRRERGLDQAAVETPQSKPIAEPCQIEPQSNTGADAQSTG